MIPYKLLQLPTRYENQQYVGIAELNLVFITKSVESPENRLTGTQSPSLKRIISWLRDSVLPTKPHWFRIPNRSRLRTSSYSKIIGNGKWCYANCKSPWHGEIQRSVCSRDWHTLYPGWNCWIGALLAGVRSKVIVRWQVLSSNYLHLNGQFQWLARCLRSIIVTGSAVGLRDSNPSIVTPLGALAFCLGFILIIITNTELAIANMFVMIYTTLHERPACSSWGVCLC
jgi:hypothetical protein